MARTLTISTGTSRGHETYGYTIVRLRDSQDGKLYRTMGGGYDMVGTVLGDWLTANCQTALRPLADRAFYVSDDVRGYRRTGDEQNALYGMYFDGMTVRIDGACGVDSVRAIARAAGVKLTALPSRRGETVGWIVGELED